MYCGGGATGSAYGAPAMLPNPDEDCADCVKTVTTYKTVQVPCTRNVTRHFTVKMPKSVPYTAYRPVTKYRTITKQMPKTIYVNVKEQVPYTIREPYQASRTVFYDEPRTSCHPVTKLITRRVPVVNVTPVNPPPCPPPAMSHPTGIPVAPGGAFVQSGTLVGKDANYDGVISPNEMGFIPSGHGHGGHHDHGYQPSGGHHLERPMTGPGGEVETGGY